MRNVFSGVIPVAAAVVCFLAGPAFAADPVVESVTATPVANANWTAIQVTFTFSDADGNPCYIALFGHDTVTSTHYPMMTFREGDIYARTFVPGTHTVVWVSSADREEVAIDTSNFVVYAQVSDLGRIAPGKYLVIDVSGGASVLSYPVEYKTYSMDVPKDIYKTDKIVLRELPNGDYAGVYEITQCQYERVTGATPSCFGGNPIRPVEQVSHYDITERDGFIARLRAKTDLTSLDLPESSAWEYACRAGATNDYNDYTQNRGKGANDETTLGNLGWYGSNSGGATHDAGRKQPNAWGLYDMHGNIWEWTTTGYLRGGHWGYDADDCQSGDWEYRLTLYRNYDIGFRLVLPAAR